MMPKILLPVIGALLALTGCSTVHARTDAGLPAPASRTPVTQAPAERGEAAQYPAGMISSADPRATEAGLAMLRRGGNATDAAIAVMLALGVVEPQSSGIGGGGFLVHAAPTGGVETIDGRETAPAAATPARFLNETGEPLDFPAAVNSGLSVGVPGNIALAAKAHARFGKLAWRDLFTPAIRLARDGFVITPRLHQALVRSRVSATLDPASRTLFYTGDGQPLAIGTLIRNPAMAQTLEMLAAQGPKSFYTGHSATGLAAKVASATPRDGKMRKGDLAGYKAVWRPAVCGTYRVYRICGMGPPSSGATTVFAILKQLERFQLSAYSPHSPTAWHLIGESQRIAYADRGRFLADTDFVTVPVAGLMDPDYLAERGRLIQPDRAMPSVQPGNPDGADRDLSQGAGPEEQGTSHFVVIDKEGSAISYTSTIESAFGSGLMWQGLYLNNELTDFSFVPAEGGRSVANRVEGGKRPRSSMAPTLVYGPDGGLVLAAGAAGGATIPAQVARILIGVLDWQLPLDKALALPVLFAPDDTLLIEQGSVLEDLIPDLIRMGHKVETRDMPLKSNAIMVTAGRLTGAADPRSEGNAASEQEAGAPGANKPKKSQ